MKRIDVDEFVANPARYLWSREGFEVMHDGRAIGYYLPRPRFTPEEKQEAMDRLQATIARVLEETGMTEDELADLFDLTKPFPYDVEGVAADHEMAPLGTKSHASDR